MLSSPRQQGFLVFLLLNKLLWPCMYCMDVSIHWAMFVKNRPCSKYRFLFKGCMPAESRCHCAGKAAAGEWRVEHRFFFDRVKSDNLFLMGQGDPAKTSQLKIIELRPAPILFRPPLSGSALLLHVKSGLTCPNKRSGSTVQHAECKITHSLINVCTT